MEYEFTVKIRISGDATEQEVRDYICFEIGAICSIDNDNPFIDDDNDCDIINVDVI